MKIAGRAWRSLPSTPTVTRFNGAGDEDRRKDSQMGALKHFPLSASTEPAMKIAGRPRYDSHAPHLSRRLQRSRR